MVYRSMAFLNDVELRLDQIEQDARDVRRHCSDRIVIADVEAQLRATRQRLENRRASARRDEMAEAALERALTLLANTIAQAEAGA
jgi:hypothetical protein